MSEVHAAILKTVDKIQSHRWPSSFWIVYIFSKCFLNDDVNKISAWPESWFKLLLNLHTANECSSEIMQKKLLMPQSSLYVLALAQFFLALSSGEFWRKTCFFELNSKLQHKHHCLLDFNCHSMISDTKYLWSLLWHPKWKTISFSLSEISFSICFIHNLSI